MTAIRPVKIGPRAQLTVEEMVRVAHPTSGTHYPPVQFDFERDAGPLDASRDWVDQVADGLSQGHPLTVYGINTGFGGNKHLRISKENLHSLQWKLIQSTAAGVGDPLDREVVRGAMLLRAHSLAQGFSGIRRVVLETLMAMLNRKVHPVIPEQGSVGASGDLAPLAHMAMVLAKDPNGEGGESGQAYWGPEGPMSGAEAMRRAGIPRIILEAKEGLALINGVQFITAAAALALHGGERALKAAQIALAMTLAAVRGTMDAFHPRLHAVRRHSGQSLVAANVRRLLEGSELVFMYERDAGQPPPGAPSASVSVPVTGLTKETVQDVYSLRCAPQVHGACLDIFGFVRQTLEGEMNSATDNPLIFVDLERENKAISGGNFHGAPVAAAADFLKIALTQIGTISERRSALLIDKNHNNGLPGFLVRGEEAGLDCGFMIPQYVAAALVSENKVLAHPASVDSIPTSANAEDHVSMGLHGARQAQRILGNVERVVAIELLCAAQALDFRSRQYPNQALGRGTAAAHQFLRHKVAFLREDRTMSADIEAIAQTIRSGELLAAVEAAIGPLAPTPAAEKA